MYRSGNIKVPETESLASFVISVLAASYRLHTATSNKETLQRTIMLFVVTGASSGIGNAVARSLARHHNVIAVARNEALLQTLKDQCGERVQILVADLSTESGRASLCEKVQATGRVNGIVHAAGTLIKPIAYQRLESKTMLSDFNVHVTAPISINNSLAGELAGGRIVYIDSYSASNLRVGWTGYSIIKAAAQMAARAAAAEVSGAKVIRVFPGGVKTPLVEAVLSAEHNSPTTRLFKEYDTNGTLFEPKVVGDYIANILINATDQQLEEHDLWDIGNPDHVV